MHLFATVVRRSGVEIRPGQPDAAATAHVLWAACSLCCKRQVAQECLILIGEHSRQASMASLTEIARLVPLEVAISAGEEVVGD